MQLLLLSGGSGKRLWPLSNDARSKQFLPLLASPNGGMESMIQRVVRQIREAKLTDNITLATNSMQRDSIISQLGEDVSIVTEPERRDTFPAIALAASYLAKEKGCAADEIVVVMPCDVYTEQGYFDTIAKMVKAVEADCAELVLMGVTPTYPSAKYGYIVPQEECRNDKCVRVARFTEKPTVEVAEQLLQQHALWNGGVFAFRLGYMTDIVHHHIVADSFKEIRNRYSEFPKISFDYEVVEKATSVAVQPYSGQWKDLGTWNTLTDELRQAVIGNAVVGDHCHNTHIINELQHPIYADGLDDLVVAASPDGIIVCKKCYTENIKNVVNNLTPRPMYEEKRWGTYRVIDDSTYSDGHHSLTKSLTVKAGHSTSYQTHRHRSETWTFVEGEGIIVLGTREQRVKAGDTVVVPVGERHAVKAVTNLTMIEVQCGHPLVEEDIERYPYEWKQ